MEPITASIIIILGKYALDKAGELGKEVGPKALDAAKEMFTTVLERVRKVDPRTADKFPENPEGYKTPMTDTLDEVVEADPEFAAQLQALMDRYEEAAKEHAAATGRVYQATLTGDGAIAQDHSVAAGAGGVAVGRDVHGGIRISGSQEDEAQEE